jgi:hemerythrin-like domain-containing protein
MLLGIGKKAPSADLVAALSECHDRIRTFGALACKLAGPSGLEAASEQVVEASEAVRRYFAVALPLHVADEEQTLAPLLAGRDGAVDAALAQMAREHTEHEQSIAALVALCERLAREPERLAELRELLASVAGPLDAALRAHLELEESAIFPMLGRLLSPAEEKEVRAAMRARRGAPGVD